MKRLSSIFVVAIAVLTIGGPAAWAGAARMSVDPGRVQWDAQVDYERAVLTVSMPNGEVVRQEFDSRQTPLFELAAGAKDGAYTYELRLVPRIDASLRKSLAEARKSGDEAAIAKLRAELPETSVVSGAFMVQAGAIVMPEGAEPPATGGRKVTTSAGSVGVITAADQVIPDDLIVQGSLCVGFDCVNNESFGFDTIRLKENNTRIKFEDTSTGTFPTNDWQLTANDSASGGASKFSIEDITGSKVPFTITAGASTNSIFVDSTGRVGLRTSTPVLDLHIATSNTPAIRLEQNNSGGFTAQTWDIAGNEANFFVRDVTGGSRLPFRIRPGAPTSSIDISADGDIGIGTASPEVKLHVFGSATSDTFVGLGPNPDGNPGTESAFNIGYGGASLGRGAGFLNVRPDSSATGPNPSLSFLTANVAHLVIDNVGDIGINCNDPSSDLVIASGTGANCPNPSSSINAGSAQFTVASSRTFKENLSPLEIPDILEKVAAIDVYKYDFKNGPKDRIGLMAEDFHEIFARGSDKYLSGDEVQMALWLAVKQLTATNQELAKRVADLEGRLPEGSTNK